MYILYIFVYPIHYIIDVLYKIFLSLLIMNCTWWKFDMTVFFHLGIVVITATNILLSHSIYYIFSSPCWLFFFDEIRNENIYYNTILKHTHTYTHSRTQHARIKLWRHFFLFLYIFLFVVFFFLLFLCFAKIWLGLLFSRIIHMIRLTTLKYCHDDYLHHSQP